MNKSKMLHSIFNSYNNYLGDKSAPPLRVDFSAILSSFFCPGPFYYYVIDSPSLTFETVSDSAQAILGVDLKNESINTLIECMHPDDTDHVLKCEDYVANFLQNRITPEKIVKYKISYCLREKTVKGSYNLFLMQTITLATTEDGALLKVLGIHSDISHITHINNYKLSLIGLGGEPSYLAIDIDKDKSGKPHQQMLTKREIEVIKLLSEGLIAKEIASNLFISTETVITHKKNALEKCHCKNTAELISFCIRNGLV